jgi:hypothetical protein
LMTKDGVTTDRVCRGAFSCPAADRSANRSPGDGVYDARLRSTLPAICRSRLPAPRNHRYSRFHRQVLLQAASGGLVAPGQTDLIPDKGQFAEDVKGQAASGSNREGESTEAGRRGGAARTSVEGSVMGLKRRGCVVRPWPLANWKQEELVDEAKPFHWQRPNIGGRVTREGRARFWERPEVQFLRATRRALPLLTAR